MRAVSLGTLLLASASGFGLGGGDVKETLILWQVLKNGGDMGTQMNMMPLLMTQLFDGNSDVMGSNGTFLTLFARALQRRIFIFGFFMNVFAWAPRYV